MGPLIPINSCYDHAESMCQNKYMFLFLLESGITRRNIIHSSASVCFCFDLGRNYTEKTIAPILVLIGYDDLLSNTPTGKNNHNWCLLTCVSDSCAFISSPAMALTSSTINFRFRLVRTELPFIIEASTGANAKLSSSF